MQESERLAAFEAMLASVQSRYEDTVLRMQDMKMQGREKSATYRQLMGQKLQLGQVIGLYRLYGLLDE